ncbi:J domain-containing protein [Pseudomonas sp. NPDC089734]|uniref:J domain-containing protein n=1 Tax=Pseudomonas sp. NPDC089734 TaxID=3364469 RepID=UPI003823B69A
MSNCWAILALPADADERSIKRQYARLLKTNRPDDDAEGFQRLHEAYQEALSIARYRNEESEPGELVVESCEQVISTPLAVSLVEHTTADNLHEQHLLAQAAGCAEVFEQKLMQRCLADAENEVGLLEVAVEQLHWLTPWQQIRLSAETESWLTQSLLDSRRAALEAQLQSGDESGFIEALQALRQQPWLASLERDEHLQRWVMIMLHNNTGWSSALFEQVSALFGWDVKKDLHPEPAFIWQSLLDRCEKDDFVRHLNRLLGCKPFSVEGRAAHLLLAPYSLAERRRLARSVDEDVRALCERLVEQLTLRYPGALEAFPHADLEGWRRPHEPFSNEARRWLGLSALLIAMVFGLSLHFQESQDPAFLLILSRPE